MRLKNSLKHKWSIVTGADSGIGLEFARELARMESDLVIISNRVEPLEKTARTLSEAFNVEVKDFCVDLCTENAATLILKFLEDNYIRPYIFINNAGIFSFDFVTSTSPAKINCFVDLHVRAVTVLSREIALLMQQNGEGRILNMSSMSCWMPMPGIALYSATKAYIRVFSRALYYEMHDSGVSVTVACPGGIATDLFGLPSNLQKLAVKLRVLQKPEDFARKAVSKMLKGKKQYINGWLNRLYIFFVAITPDRVRLLIKRRMLDRNIRR